MADDMNNPAAQSAGQAVDDEFLKQMGLEGLSGDDKQAALDDILYTLNVNVGKRVIDQLTDEQKDELDHLTDGEPNEEALADWLKTRVPNYEQLITEEAEKMRQQASSITEKVMSASKNQEVS